MWKRKPAAPPLSEPVVVVAAADDNYALPLAVTIRSAIDSLRPQQQLVVNILDGGIQGETKVRLARSWAAPHEIQGVQTSPREAARAPPNRIRRNDQKSQWISCRPFSGPLLPI